MYSITSNCNCPNYNCPDSIKLNCACHPTHAYVACFDNKDGENIKSWICLIWNALSCRFTFIKGVFHIKICLKITQQWHQVGIKHNRSLGIQYIWKLCQMSLSFPLCDVALRHATWLWFFDSFLVVYAGYDG